MQYLSQGLICTDPARKDLLIDIGNEELSHLEVIGVSARAHLAPLREKWIAAEQDPLIAVVGGGGVSLNNAEGNPWTTDYLKISGQREVDLRPNMAAEARANITYERLLNYTDELGSRDALKF